MDVEFEWERFEEDDRYWDALFVRINKGRWLMAEVHFNSEDQSVILQKINDNKEYWETFKR